VPAWIAGNDWIKAMPNPSRSGSRSLAIETAAKKSFATREYTGDQRNHTLGQGHPGQAATERDDDHRIHRSEPPTDPASRLPACFRHFARPPGQVVSRLIPNVLAREFASRRQEAISSAAPSRGMAVQNTDRKALAIAGAVPTALKFCDIREDPRRVNGATRPGKIEQM
jgi:hypothetical protein